MKALGTLCFAILFLVGWEQPFIHQVREVNVRMVVARMSYVVWITVDSSSAANSLPLSTGGGLAVSSTVTWR